MITYNDIYESARKERYSENLQKLPKNFIEEVSNYLKEKREVVMKEDDAFSDSGIKTKKQLENAVTLFKELMRRRREKLLRMIMIASETGISKQDFENMLVIEKELFESIMKEVELSDKKSSEMLNGKVSEGSLNELISFSEDVDGVFDFNGGQVGPFLKGQVANIPKEIAKIFVEDGKAIILEGY